MSEASDDRVGKTLLGRFEVLRRLGAGGMGTVYEVEHRITGHRRALKVLHSRLASSGEAVARLVREAGVAGRVGSDAIAETYDVGRLEDGSAYILMELLEGATVGQLLEAQGRFPPEVAARIARRLCIALAGAHEHGVVHRDIKPDNVFVVGGDAAEARVKLLDFGVATMAPGHTDQLPDLTRTGTTPGTPLYMAPEQMTEGAQVDGRADLYAVALVLYEMLAGRRPFTATTLVGLVTQVHRGEFIPLREAAPHVDATLAALVHRGMSPDPAARFPNALAMAEALAPFEQASSEQPRLGHTPFEQVSVAASAPLAEGTPAASSRGPSAVLWIAAAASVLVLVAGGGVAALWWWSSEGDAPARLDLAAAGEGGDSTDGIAALPELEEDIASLARRGRARECLARALDAPPTARVVRLRLSCARAAGDWEAYRRACDLQEARHPEEDPARGCRHTLSLHETGAVR